MLTCVDYVIAIPTYRRAKTLQEKTLRMLDGYGIRPDQVDVWLADEEQERIYGEAFAGWDRKPNFMIGVPGLGPQRNFIERYYGKGQRVMMMDDDLTGVLRRASSKKLEPVEDLRGEVLDLGFEYAERVGAGLWGVYAVQNPYFMKRRLTTTLCNCISCFIGIVCDPQESLERTVSHAEDYEYSIRRYIVDGAVCRLDWLTIDTKYWSEPGGLVEQRTPHMIHESVQKVANLFPDFCTLYVRKTTGNSELRLRDKRLG